jgi:hypothetical protein
MEKVSFHILVVFMAILNLYSCGDKKPAEKELQKQNKTSKKSAGVFSDEEIRKATTEGILECGERSCPTGIAKVTIIEKGNKVFQCSGFLINQETIVTNRHCLTDDLIGKHGVSCRGKLYFTFPASDLRPSKTIGCEQLIHSSPRGVKDNISFHMDYAILKLAEKVDYTPFQTDLKGIPPKSKLSSWVVDHEGLFKSSIRKIQCQTIPLSLLSQDHFDEWTRIVTASTLDENKETCRAIPGNSGSVILNEDGLAVGVLSSIAMGDKIYSAIAEEYSGYIIDKNLHQLVFFQNLSCIQNSVFKGRQCLPYKDDYSQDNEKYFDHVMKTRTKGHFRRLLDHAESTYVQWEIDEKIFDEDDENQDESEKKQEKKDYILRTIPKCIEKDGLEKLNQITKITPPSLKAKIVLNRFAQMTINFEEISEDKFPVEISRKKDGMFQIQLKNKISDQYDSYSKFESFLVPICPSLN